MPLMQLAQPLWQGSFDAASKAIGVQTVKVEVTGLQCATPGDFDDPDFLVAIEAVDQACGIAPLPRS